MLKTRVIYCGNIPEIADIIFLSKEYVLHAIIIEENRISDEILTFCFLREIPHYIVKNKFDVECIIDENISIFDCMILCGFSIILHKGLLEKIPTFNFHPGKLPEYKGRHPTYYATVNGEPSIYITLHEVNDKIDGGNIISTKEIPYKYNYNESDIIKLLPEMVCSMLPDINLFLKGKLNGIQNIGGNYYPPVGIEEKKISSKKSIAKNLRIIKAQKRYGGGILEFNNNQYSVDSACVSQIRNLDKHISNLDGVLHKNLIPIGIEIDNKYYLKFNSIKQIND